MTVPSGILGVDPIGEFVLGYPIGGSLAEIFPQGTSRWVGLWLVLPDEGGVGGTESILVRQEVSRWITVDGNRLCEQRIAWAIDDSMTVVGFGVWDASVAGNLLAFGELQLEVGVPRTFKLSPGDTAQFIPFDFIMSLEGNLTLFDVYNDDYSFPLRQLLPHGSVWNKLASSVLGKTIGALARDFSRVDLRVRHMIDESDPTTCEETIDDWERVVALPGPCVTDPPTELQPRRDAVVAKLTRNVSPNAQAFIDLAEGLGYTGVTFTNNANPFTCNSECDDSLYGNHWMHVATLHVDNNLHELNSVLRCLVGDMTPLDRVVLFDAPSWPSLGG